MGLICMTAEEVRELDAAGRVWIRRLPRTTRGLRGTLGVMEPWYQLQPPTGSYAGGAPRYIRESEARAEPVLFRYRPAETMPVEAIRRYVRIEQIGPTGCLCVLDSELSKMPQERMLERVRSARITRYGEEPSNEWQSEIDDDTGGQHESKKSRLGTSAGKKRIAGPEGQTEIWN